MPYEEQLRLFVKGQAEFPEDAALLVTVSSSANPSASITTLFPWLRSKTGGYKRYAFTVPGLLFELGLGKALPQGLRQACILRSNENLIFFGNLDAVLSGFAKLIEKSTPKGSLAKKLLEDG